MFKQVFLLLLMKIFLMWVLSEQEKLDRMQNELKKLQENTNTPLFNTVFT